jgi:HAD superfamily hydrolase (TIGR01509 family)
MRHENAVEGRPAACIFDLDGTLIDSEPSYLASDRAFLKPWGIEYSDEFNAEMMGRGSVDFFTILAALNPDSPLSALPLEERIRLRDAYYLEHGVKHTKAFPSMRTLAELLHSRGLALAIASGSSPEVIAASLEITGLRPFFPVVVSSSEVARGKPEPDIFLEAARRLGVEPTACLVFEDAIAGLAAAERAGMRCIVLPAPGSALADFASAARVFEGGPAAASAQTLLDAALSLAPVGAPLPSAQS